MWDCDCDIKCVWTTDKNAAPLADANFNYVNAAPAKEWPIFKEGQAKVLFNLEPFRREYIESLGYDIVVGYDQSSSTIPITYAGPITYGAGGLMEKKFVDSNEKRSDYLGIYINSGCYGDRIQYMTELMNHFPVMSIGNCLTNANRSMFTGECKEGTKHWVETKKCVISKFKFYFAFENVKIVDYVTEKIFSTLDTNTIPVYRGAPNVEDFVPEHSYINVDNFASPKELADYLYKLSNDTEAYNEYFAWRNKPLSKGYLDKWAKRTDTMFCRTCELLARRDFTLKNTTI